MNELIKEKINETKQKMEKSVLHTQNELSQIRTSRATPSIVDRLEVDYYGTNVALKQLASFHVVDAKQLVITPYDKSAIKAIEKTIIDANLGITPNNDGQVIRLNFPPLTEERRKELVKTVKHLAEEGRVSVRNLRRHLRNVLEGMHKNGEITEEELNEAEKVIEKNTHEYITEIDKMLAAKEKDLLSI